ncbi:MAG: hypothetical protein LBU79_00255 [Planctomycetota bacterium]|nr:hypothetical protein [Planctomycetota bacterium]
MTTSPLKPVKLEIWQGSLPFRFTFRHHLASRRHTDTLILSLTLAGGAMGFGQAIPRKYLSGETPEGIRESLEELWLEARESWFFPTAIQGKEDILAVLDPLYRRSDTARRPAAYAALETAVLDALARHRGHPLNLLWSSSPSPRELVGVIPIAPPGMAGWLARLLRWLGYRRFKVKVGSDPLADRQRLAAVRKAIGPAAWLSADANQAWTLVEAEKRLADWREFGLSLVEEPLAPGEGSLLGELEAKTGMAMMADESIISLADAQKLLASGSPSWWNLRLGKNGGFSGLAALADLATRNNIKIYGGVLVGETGCLAAAGRAALGLVDYVCQENAFSRLLLASDPFRGAPGGFRGRAEPLSRPGLGVDLRRERLNSFTYHCLE